MYLAYEKYYTALRDKGIYRALPKPSTPLTAAKKVIDFSTHDYLALSREKALLAAAHHAGLDYGTGATGARLLSGNHAIFEDLEAQIAQDKGEEAALILNSGFQANMTVLASLLDKNVLGAQPLVFFDRLNHASLYQAVFLSGAELQRYRHNDIQHLTDLMLKFQQDSRPKFIVSETIFGMDGDQAQLMELVALAKKYQAFLYLDEAHATGVIGRGGYGLSTTVDLSEISHLVMGTFSKALGCSGAYIACSEVLKTYLINKCQGFIYSTALSPMVIGAAAYAWNMIRNLGEQRKQLFTHADKLRQQLKNLGLSIGASSTQIIPIILGSENLTIQIKENLLQANMIVSAVRPPTVPPKTSRLRIALNTKHTETDSAALVSALQVLL